jgi:ABC-type phosphate transport system permease subunit
LLLKTFAGPASNRTETYDLRLGRRCVTANRIQSKSHDREIIGANSRTSSCRCSRSRARFWSSAAAADVFSSDQTGASSINWAFFTQLPKPVGETGGGMANAIVGTFVLLAQAAVFGVPVGVLGGVFLSEYGGTAA